MKKFTQLIHSTLLAALLAGAPLAAWAQKPPQEGIEYLTLDKPQPTESAGKVEVIEFFGYWCPHCNALEPTLETWAKKLPKDVVLRRVPVVFNEAQAPYARTYYALEALNKLDEMHAKVFAAIHVQRERWNKPEDVADWMAKQGIDRDAFMKAYTSFTVQSKTNRAMQLAQAYKIDGVPTLAVGGRYVTSGTLAGTNEKALGIVDYLIAEARKSVARK
jgi:thiol:disulfide interchange protein DsbA